VNADVILPTAEQILALNYLLDLYQLERRPIEIAPKSIVPDRGLADWAIEHGWFEIVEPSKRQRKEAERDLNPGEDLGDFIRPTARTKDLRERIRHLAERLGARG